MHHHPSFALADVADASAERLRRLAAVLAAAALGLFIVAGVGFAGPSVLHDAAHDVRHGMSFPCH
jgi:cobalt transporter subunit CbtB